MPKLVRTVYYLLAVLLALAIFLPFLWMFSTSIKPLREVYSIPPTVIPRDFAPENYPIAFQRAAALRAFFVTAVYALGCVVLYLFVAALAGYAFARYRFYGKNLLFILVLATLMIPIEVNLLPLYRLLKSIRWLNSFQGLILPRVVEPFGIFLFRQHFQTIPDEYVDSARIDGCRELTIFRRIMLPMSTPPVIVACLFMFLWRWNELLYPLVICTSNLMRTIQVVISLFVRERYVEWNFQMALCVAAILPILILFIAIQKYFVQGVVLTGMKG
jgi:ABC-type glycerol-3-phosphate transport system permease component